jgi:lysophospholipase L1-like esterase
MMSLELRRLAVGAIAVVLGIAASGPPAWSADTKIPLSPLCQVPSELIADTSPLRHAAKRVVAERRLKIVALGSSSTLGLGASGPQATYPARLEAILAARFPNYEVRVINKGVSRQSAQQMVDRLDADVLAEKPTLVIWETGTAEAVRGADVDELMTALLAGIDRMQAAGIDVVLMDTQYSRMTAQLINFQPYVAAIEQVSSMRDLVLFHRYAVMRYWVDADRFAFTDKSPSEARRIADGVYDCLGQLLAASIVKGMGLK